MRKRISKSILYILCIAFITSLGCSRYVSFGNQTIDGTKKETKEEHKYKRYEDCIFNESSIKLLANEDIEGYDKVLLQKGINEIYARHGYIFNQDKWNEYFNKKEWYKESEEFSIDDLNEIEKQNIMFLKGSECIKSKGDLNFDVDLDGEKEVLDFSIENIRKNAEKTYVDFQYNDSYYGALVTDIDINDKQQEILIFDGGPSGDDTIGLYRYDEESNKFIYINSSTARHYDYSINGNRYIKLEGDRHGIYVINIYKLIEGHLEYVNTEYYQYTISKNIGQIPKGTKVTILGFDYKDDQKYTGTEGINHGPNGLLGIKITPVSDKTTIEVIDLSLYDTIRRRNDDTREIVPFDVLMDMFDEIGNMYYGD